MMEGIVRKIGKRRVDVELVEEVRCSGCAIASGCAARPVGEMVAAWLPAGVDVRVGDRVSLAPPRWGSMMTTTVVPACLMIAVAAVLGAVGVSSSATAAAGLLTAALWYAALALLRKRFLRLAGWQIVAPSPSQQSAQGCKKNAIAAAALKKKE